MRPIVASAGLLALLAASGCVRLLSRTPTDTGPADGPPPRPEAAPSPDRSADRARADAKALPPRTWIWENPKPTWARLNAVWVAPAGDAVFAVGNAGTILRHDPVSKLLAADALPAGSSPTAAPAPDLHAVWGSSKQDVYAVGEKVLLRYDGSTWTRTDVDATLRGICGVGDMLFIVGERDGDGIFRWGSLSALQEKTVPIPLRAVWAAGPTVAFAAGTYTAPGISVYRFEGGNLLPFPSPTLYTGHTIYPNALWGRASPQELVVGGRYGTIGFIARHANSAWETLPTVVGQSVDGLWGTATAAYAVGRGTGLLQHAGSAWSAAAASNPWSPAATPLAAVSGLGAGELFVAGDYGLLARGTVGGDFSSVKGADSIRGDLVSVWSSPTLTIAAGGPGVLRRTSAGTWEQINVASGWVDAVWGRGEELFLAMRPSGNFATRLYRWTPAGGAVELPRPLAVENESFEAIWGSSAPQGPVYFVGSRETIVVHDPAATSLVVVHQSDVAGAVLEAVWGWPEAAPQTVVAVGGNRMITVQAGVPSSETHGEWGLARDVWGTSSLLLVASQKGMHRRDAAGWSANAAPGECTSVWGSGPTEVYALCAKGLQLWDGARWSDEPLPAPARGNLPALEGQLFGHARAGGSTLTIVGKGGAILRSP